MIVILFMSNEQTSIEKQGHSYKFIIFVLEQKNRNVLVVFTSKIGLDFRLMPAVTVIEPSYVFANPTGHQL